MNIYPSIVDQANRLKYQRQRLANNFVYYHLKDIAVKETLLITSFV